MAGMALFLCALLELAFRAIYPEFANDIYSRYFTRGQRATYVDTLEGFEGIVIRVPYADYRLARGRKTVLVAGDSISEGFGSAFEDIYWNRFQRLVNMSHVDSIQCISLAGYGNNLRDSSSKLGEYFMRKQIYEVSDVLYQFNYNDIIPYGKAELKEVTCPGIRGTRIFQSMMRWRYAHMNRSVFCRVMQHYAGVLLSRLQLQFGGRQRLGLGAYTWAYGSKAFTAESEKLWIEFERNLRSISDLARKNNAKFAILISPLIFDIDVHKYHPYYNCYGLDFSDATINARERLHTTARRLGIDLIDPTDYVKEHFEERIKEGNFTPFYFPGDENHFNQIAAEYIGEYMFASYLKDLRGVGKMPTHGGCMDKSESNTSTVQR